MKKHKGIRSVSILLVFATVLASCGKPRQEAADFIFKDNKFCGVKMLDNVLTLGDVLHVWKEKYNANITETQNGNEQRINVEVPVSNKTNLNIVYTLIGGLTTKTEVHTSFDVNDQTSELQGYNELILERSKLLATNGKYQQFGLMGREDVRNHQILFYYDLMAQLTANKEEFLKKATHPDKSVTIDYKRGTLEVPANKVWMIKRRRLLEPSTTDSMVTSIPTNSCGCDYISQNGIRVLPDIVINLECMRLKGAVQASRYTNYGDAESQKADASVLETVNVDFNYEYQILHPGTTVCIPIPQGYARAYLDVEEYDLIRFPEMAESVKILQHMSFDPGEENISVRLLNGK